MRFLFTTIPERGHLNPLIGVAQHLEAEGHELAFCAEGDLRGALAAAGLRARGYPGAADRRRAEVTAGRAFIDRIADPAWLRGWIRRLLVEEVPAQLPALRAACDDFRPDAIVNDPMLYGPILVAMERGLPWAGLSSSLNPVTPAAWRCELTETVRWLAEDRARLFASAGRPAPEFRVCDAISPYLNVAFTIPEYAPPGRAGGGVFCVGPSRPRPGAPRGDEVAFPFDLLTDDRPVVYMSLGSQLYHQPELFAAAIEALCGEGVRLVLALGGLMDEPFAAGLPDFVLPVRWAPQLRLLRRAALLISHGGANSLGEGLAAGVPILCLPQCNDQPLGARFLVESGAGLALPRAEATGVDVGALRDACRRLLRPDARERARARALGAALSARDGAREAAALLGELAASRAPLAPPAEAA